MIGATAYSVSTARVEAFPKQFDSFGNTNRAGFSESFVLDFKHFLAVKKYDEMCAGKFHAQCVPLVRRDFFFDAVELGSGNIRLRALPRPDSVAALSVRARLYVAELSPKGQVLRSGWYPSEE